MSPREENRVLSRPRAALCLAMALSFAVGAAGAGEIVSLADGRWVELKPTDPDTGYNVYDNMGNVGTGTSVASNDTVTGIMNVTGLPNGGSSPTGWNNKYAIVRIIDNNTVSNTAYKLNVTPTSGTGMSYTYNGNSDTVQGIAAIYSDFRGNISNYGKVTAIGTGDLIVVNSGDLTDTKSSSAASAAGDIAGVLSFGAATIIGRVGVSWSW